MNIPEAILNMLFCVILMKLNFLALEETKKTNPEHKQLLIYISQIFTVYLIYKFGISLGYIILKVL